MSDPSDRADARTRGGTPGLLEDIADIPEWYRDAACLDADPGVFFPDKGDPTSPARHICNTICTVREQCLEYALANNENSGVWGGHGARARRRMRRERGWTD